MAIAVAVFALIIVALSLLGLLAPTKLVGIVRGFMKGPAGLWGAVGLRVVMAVLLWLTAAESRTPLVFQIIAVLALTAAVVLPFVGLARIQRLVTRIALWPPTLVRVPCLLGVALGGFLLWSIGPAAGIL